jgi:hypothetical protein
MSRGAHLRVCLANDDVSLNEKPGILVLVRGKNERPGFLTATNLNRGLVGKRPVLTPPIVK